MIELTVISVYLAANAAACGGATRLASDGRLASQRRAVQRD
jgi:hypothetical protein